MLYPTNFIRCTKIHKIDPFWGYFICVFYYTGTITIIEKSEYLKRLIDV